MWRGTCWLNLDTKKTMIGDITITSALTYRASGDGNLKHKIASPCEHPRNDIWNQNFHKIHQMQIR